MLEKRELWGQQEREERTIQCLQSSPASIPVRVGSCFALLLQLAILCMLPGQLSMIQRSKNDQANNTMSKQARLNWENLPCINVLRAS